MNNLVVETPSESEQSILGLMTKKRLASQKLLDSLQKIVDELVEAKNIDNKLNIEAHANLVYTLLYIANNTKHKSLKKLCLDSLEGADKESLEELAKYHRQQGITMALFEIQNKIDLAKNLNSDLSVVVGEAYYAHLQKLLD